MPQDKVETKEDVLCWVADELSSRYGAPILRVLIEVDGLLARTPTGKQIEVLLRDCVSLGWLEPNLHNDPPMFALTRTGLMHLEAGPPTF